ncbi:hypothetical protein MAR_035596 [Mya arenaria]|uniref:Uncharacterized protein n=1 Tax=Mya arenaria TaxID=6604 RepID=A0ABY7EKK2_MYAAR|nr:hypothetical protein MAR_035596 [Mya arenaria]
MREELDGLVKSNGAFLTLKCLQDLKRKGLEVNALTKDDDTSTNTRFHTTTGNMAAVTRSGVLLGTQITVIRACRAGKTLRIGPYERTLKK